MILQLHLHMLNSYLCATAPALIYATPLFSKAFLSNATEQSFKGLLAFYFPPSLIFFSFSKVFYENADGKISAHANDHISGFTFLSLFLFFPSALLHPHPRPCSLSFEVKHGLPGP